MVQSGARAPGDGRGQGQPAPILAWVGSAADGRVDLCAPDGSPQSFPALAPLADHLRVRGDPAGGCTACAAALGVALHALRLGDPGTALDEAEALLAGLPVAPLLARLRACIAAHADLLAGATLAARLVLEARRMQRLHEEAVARAVDAARGAVPQRGRLLLAWPGGAACDLGPGLLVGAVVASGRRHAQADDLLISGPPALAASAVAELAAHGLPSRAVDAAAAQAAMPGGVLLRAGSVDPAALVLAATAARRRVPVLAIGIERPDATPLPPGCRACLVPPATEAAC